MSYNHCICSARLFLTKVHLNCAHFVLNDCVDVNLCVYEQASCADDKELWVQLLQDGSSTADGPPYQHTSHESLRYTHTHTHSCCLPAFFTNYESLKLCHSFPILLFLLFFSGLKSRRFPTSNMYMDDPFQQLCGGVQPQPIYSNTSILEHMVRCGRGVLLVITLPIVY